MNESDEVRCVFAEKSYTPLSARMFHGLASQLRARNDERASSLKSSLSSPPGMWIWLRSSEYESPIESFSLP